VIKGEIMWVPRLACLAVAGILALAAPALPPAAAVTAPAAGLVSAEHIITTLYAYPGGSSWNLVTGNAPVVGASIVDMCGADGSGSGCDGSPWTAQPPPAWATQIEALQNAGITPLVYIATDYGDAGGSPAFSLATVESEVSEAVGWYGTGIGFMFDQGATTCALEASYYGPLYGYVKSVTHDGTVELSPGTVSAGMSCYMNAADILQVFEGPETGNARLGLAGFQGHAFPSWLRDYPASRFAATISQATAAGAGTDAADAAAARIGNIYIDDEREPDPGYQTLPSFWPAEVADVAGLAPAGPAPQHLTVPLYAAANSAAWTQVTGSVPAVKAAVVDICAPDGTGSGCAGGKPADAPNPAWPATIGALRSAGVLPLYYIDTGYGTTPLATVEAEAADAVRWYGTPSVMFDQVPASCSDVPYYQDLYDYVHARGGIVMLDPGTVTASSSCYMPVSDILGVFAGSQAGFQAATFPSWLAGYPSSRFWAVISAGTTAGVGTDVADAAADGIGNVYVDDEAEPPSYATLPAFWQAEVADVTRAG
jgi:Spherulation-specific family 4